MDCNTAREQLDGHPNDAVAAHLQECAACRAEAAFRDRIAAAILAMPAATAPDTLPARIMAEVERAPLKGADTEQQRVSTPWMLPTWEIAALAVACLLLVLIPMALGLVAWSPGAALAPEALADWIGSVRMSADLLLARVTTGAGSTFAIGNPRSAFHVPLSGVSLMAGVAVTAFALALALLLSWRGNGMALGEESARA